MRVAVIIEVRSGKDPWGRKYGGIKMELEKAQKNVGKMLERFRKGKEDMSAVFTKGSSFSRGGKDEQGCYSRGRVIIFRNEKKIVDGSYNSKSSDFAQIFASAVFEREMMLGVR